MGLALAPDSAPVRSWLRSVLERQLDALCAGQVQIDRIARLSFGGVLAEGVTVRDAQNRPVLHGERLSLGFDPLSLLRLRLRFTHGLLEDARIWAIPSGETAITLFDALAPPGARTDAPPASEPGLDVSFEHIHVTRAHLYGSVPGLADLELVGLDARGEILVIDGELKVRVSQVRGDLTRPFEHALAIDHAIFALDTGPLRMSARARISRGADRVRAALRYRAPPHEGPLAARPGATFGATPGAARAQEPRTQAEKRPARQTTAEDDRLELLLALEPVSPELLGDLHFGAAEVLLSPLRGYARFFGPLRELSVVSALETDAGAIAIRGRLRASGQRVLHIESRALELAQLLAYAPPLRLRVAVDVEAEPDGTVALRLAAPELALYGIELQDAEFAGVYAAERLSLERARLRFAGGRFELSGWVDADADLALRVRSQVPELARDPTLRRTGLRGGLRSDLHIGRRGDVLTVEGSVGLVAPSYRGFEAKELVLEGKASGLEELSRARLDLTGTSWGSALFGRAIGDLGFRVRGKSPRIAADFELIDRRARTAVAHLELHQERAGYRVILSPLEVGVAGREPWRAKADLTLSASDVTFHEVFLVNGPQRLDLRGRYSYRHEYQVDASLKSFDLGGLRELSGLDLADLDGTVGGEVSLTGTPGHPRIDARGTVTSGVFLGMRELALELALESVEGRFDIDAKLVLPDKSRLSLYAGGEPGPGPDWPSQIGAGNYQFGVDFERVPFEVARPWLAWLGVEPPGGTVSATVRGAGSLAEPYFDLKSQVERLQVPNWPALDMNLELEHDGARASLQSFRVADRNGEIARLQGFLEARAAELFDPLALRASLGTRPLELVLSWENRRLDELPEPLRVALALPSWGSLRVAQTELGPSLELRARLGWPEGSEGLAACGARRHPELTLALSAHDLRTTGKLIASLDAQQLAMADVEADTPIVAWLTGAEPLYPPRTSFTLNAATDAAEEVPGLCELVAGPLRVDVSALDAFADPPELRLEARSSALQLVAHSRQRQRLGSLRDARSSGRPFALAASLGVEGASLTFRGELEQDQGGRLRVSGSFPRAPLFGGGPASAEWPLAEAELEARRLELASLLLALPLGIRAGGQLDGKAQLQYDFSPERVLLSGALSLRDGTLALGGLGQELSELHGRLVLRDDTIRVEALEARDFDGRLAIEGALTVVSARELGTDLGLTLRDFPIRRESAPVSKLSGKMRLRATSTPERTRAELALAELRVNLPSDLASGLQPIDDHPDIVVRGETPEEPDDDPYTFELRIDARDPPFRVLRSDLSAEVAGDLSVRYRAPSLTLQGGAEIERGSFDLFGKRFELRESRLSFDGSEGIDPLIIMDAVHRAGSDRIGVRVEGRLSDPTISFSHSNPEITQTGDIIAELLGARSTDTSGQSGDATGAAAGILAGATAGLLTREVREQFGGALPVLSLESSSQTLRSARIRAGVQLDQLIERRLGPLRRVVRGAYVEGFVAPGASAAESAAAVNTTAAPQSRGGGLLELRFPKDLVGTVEYRPVQNWRLDVAWEP